MNKLPTSQEEVYCFIDSRRPCSADCMAYRTVGQDNHELDPAQQHCVIISSVERTGRGLMIIGSIGSALLKQLKITAGDSKREQATPDVTPRRG